MIYWNEEAKMWWVDSELPRVYKWMVNHIDAIDYALQYMPRRGFCIQAGAYLGMWPAALSKHFQRVLCFEPIMELYECCLRNLELAKAANVVAYPQCLSGGVGGMRYMARKHGGRSTVQLPSDEPVQFEPVMGVVIDELELPVVDALFLDVERSELDVLKGAAQTIERDRPVIVLEVLTGQEHYHEYMAKIGYRKVGRSHSDWVYVP